MKQFTFLLFTFLLVALFIPPLEAQKVIIINGADTTFATFPTAGDTIGTGVSYTPEGLGATSNTVVAFLYGLLASLFVYLSYRFPALRKLPPLLANPQVRVLIATGLTAIMGWIAKFDTGSTSFWSYFVGVLLTSSTISVGLYEFILKKLFGRSSQ